MPDILAPLLFPVGAITYFSGLLVNIPKGWQLCDGTNGTPDMHDTFFRGAPAGLDAGGTGGQNNVILDITMIPSHTHSFSNTGHTHTQPGLTAPGYASGGFLGKNSAGDTTTTSSSGISLNNAGSGSSHNNKPAYVECAHIMRMY